MNRKQQLRWSLGQPLSKVGDPAWKAVEASCPDTALVIDDNTADFCRSMLRPFGNVHGQGKKTGVPTWGDLRDGHTLA